jgi:nucleotide-binding universal stress UspA family protein
MAAVHAYDVAFEGALQRAGVHAGEIDRHRAEAFEKALNAIRRLSEAASGDPTLFLPIAERGHAARLILEHERTLGADLVVIGKRRRSVLESVLLGSVTRHVLADAKADVLVVHDA